MKAWIKGPMGRVAVSLAIAALLGLCMAAGSSSAQSSRQQVGSAKRLAEPILAVDRVARTITVGTVTYRVDANSRLFGLDGNRTTLGEIRLLPPRERIFGAHATVVVDRSSPSGMPVIRELKMVPGLAR